MNGDTLESKHSVYMMSWFLSFTQRQEMLLTPLCHETPEAVRP